MKPIVFLVDDVREGDPLYIKTAYETSNQLLPRRDIAWGNSFVYYGQPREKFNPTSLHNIPEIMYESLADSKFDKDAIYIYLIPCAIELDVGNQLFHNILDPVLLQKLADNNVSILFDYSNEVYEVKFGLHGLYRWLDVLKRKNPNYKKPILVSSANLVSDMHYDRNLVRVINLPMRAINERSAYINAANSGMHIDLDTFLTTRKSHLFLNLNLQPRLHRVFFVKRLLVEKLQEHGLISFASDVVGNVNLHHSCVELDSKRVHDKYLRHTAVDYKIVAELSEEPLPKLSVDNDTATIGRDQNCLYNPEWAYTTCFDIISETGSFVIEPDYSPVVSEKVFKSICYNRVFMVNGDKHNLSMLQNMGFKTFPEIFNETYDNYSSMFDRHELIVKNINQYKNDYSLVLDKIANSRSIIEHNYNLLMTPGKLEKELVRIINEGVK